MFGSKILEVAIGVIFVFLLVSIICSAIREWLETIVKSRSTFLEYGIRELLHDKGAVGLARSFYTHPLIYSLYSNDYTPGPVHKPPTTFARGRNLPSYIPARNFALALLDIASRGTDTRAASSDASSPVLSLASARRNIANVENPYVQRALLTAIDSAQGDMDKAVANLGAWYDSAMDRVSGAYKRQTQKILLVIGAVVAVSLNVNSIEIAKYLYHNDTARADIVARAEVAANDSSLVRPGSTVAYSSARAQLDSLEIPMGWDRSPLRQSDSRRRARLRGQDDQDDLRLARRLERDRRSDPRLAHHRTRGNARRPVLVRRVEQDHGHSIDREAAREEP